MVLNTVFITTLEEIEDQRRRRKIQVPRILTSAWCKLQEAGTSRIWLSTSSALHHLDVDNDVIR